MKYCTNCHTAFADGVQVCSSCGCRTFTPASAGADFRQAHDQSSQTGSPNGQPVIIHNAAPVGQLKTDRSLLKFILLSIVTLGIYAIVYMSGVSGDLNIVASRYDGKQTPHYCLMLFILMPLTLGIYWFVWYHKFSARIGSELRRRNIACRFDAADFWLWHVLGSLIVVGPFVYVYKLSKAMNLLSENYNQNG